MDLISHLSGPDRCEIQVHIRAGTQGEHCDVRVVPVVGLALVSIVCQALVGNAGFLTCKRCMLWA